MVEITRSQIIVVDDVAENEYNDLLFSDKEGTQYKVSNKRRQYFDKVIIPGAAVQLNFATAYNKEYIYSVELVKDKLPVEKPTEKPSLKADIPQRIKTEGIAPQEKGMWWKEVGENFRAGLFKKDDGKNGTLLWKAYIAQMLASLEIKIEKRGADDENNPSKS